MRTSATSVLLIVAGIAAACERGGRTRCVELHRDKETLWRAGRRRRGQPLLSVQPPLLLRE